MRVSHNQLRSRPARAGAAPSPPATSSRPAAVAPGRARARAARPAPATPSAGRPAPMTPRAGRYGAGVSTAAPRPRRRHSASARSGRAADRRRAAGRSRCPGRRHSGQQALPARLAGRAPRSLAACARDLRDLRAGNTSAGAWAASVQTVPGVCQRHQVQRQPAAPGSGT